MTSGGEGFRESDPEPPGPFTFAPDWTPGAKGWLYVDGIAGSCVECDEPCRSFDPEGLPRHPLCLIAPQRPK
jgi:hypothetical protein